MKSVNTSALINPISASPLIIDALKTSKGYIANKNILNKARLLFLNRIFDAKNASNSDKIDAKKHGKNANSYDTPNNLNKITLGKIMPRRVPQTL